LLYVRIVQRCGITLVVATALGACASLPARAEELPSEPIVVAGGRLIVGGDLSEATSCAHSNLPNAPRCTGDTGFFNYTDYQNSALRLFRVDLTAALKATDRLSVLTEIRSENAAAPQAYGLYLRIRPWKTRDIDFQVGRVPPTFGAFARRTYASDNLLIGYPLAYQYVTTLRPDALPATADDLLRIRGRGWLSTFPVGNPAAGPGMPLVSAFSWDTGVQVHAANALVDVAASVTMGTLGNPLVEDDNAGKQVAARVALHPAPGLIVGVSGASGPFVTRQAAQLAGVESENGSFTQTAWGADVEYSRGYYLLRAEAIVSDWRVPILGTPVIALPLRAVGTSAEGRYKIRPGLYAAGRVDHLGFSSITGSSGTATWDAPVTRTEVGGGYSLQRNLQLKVSFQRNTRDGGRATRVDVAATQLVFWF
jgi:hypothetical protein